MTRRPAEAGPARSWRSTTARPGRGNSSRAGSSTSPSWTNGKPQALPVSEIDFTNMPEGAPQDLQLRGQVVRGRYALRRPRRPSARPRSTTPCETKLQETAVAAFLAMGCRDYARVDFRMDKKGTTLHPRGQSQPGHQPQCRLCPGAGRRRHRVQELLADR